MEDIVNSPMGRQLEMKYNRRNDVDNGEETIPSRGKFCAKVAES